MMFKHFHYEKEQAEETSPAPTDTTEKEQITIIYLNKLFSQISQHIYIALQDKELKTINAGSPLATTTRSV